MPLVAVVVFAALASLTLWMANWVRPRPRERLVLLGRPGKTPDAPRVKLLASAVWPLPVLERVERLPLGPIAVQLDVKRARAQGGERVDARLDARLSIRVGQVLAEQGLEALLGKSPDEIAAIAGVLLRGNLVVALARHPLPADDGARDRLLAELFFLAAPLLDTLALELDRDTLRLDVVRVDP
jgi:uncharacterized membrane protein YqiK